MNQNILFIDAETDGLYGDFITVGMIIVDKYGIEKERYYLGRNLDEMIVTNEWVLEHVIPKVGICEQYESQEELLEKVWEIWNRLREDTDVIADVTFPVESRLWHECVKLDEEARMFKAPFPLMDLSSMLYAKGIDPLQARLELVGMKEEDTQHNALYDVKVSIEVWKKYFMNQL